MKTKKQTNPEPENEMTSDLQIPALQEQVPNVTESPEVAIETITECRHPESQEKNLVEEIPAPEPVVENVDHQGVESETTAEINAVEELPPVESTVTPEPEETSLIENTLLVEERQVVEHTSVVEESHAEVVADTFVVSAPEAGVVVELTEEPTTAEETVSEDADDEEQAELPVIEQQAPAEQPLVELVSEHDSEEDPHEEDAEEFDESVGDKDDTLEKMSRQELVEVLESLVHEPDINKIKAKVALVKVAFLKKEKEEKLEQYNQVASEGIVAENFSPEPDQISERFHAAFIIYRENKQRFNEDLEKQKQVNLETKKRILEDLRNLINSEETLKKTYDEFKTLQDEWKQTGIVPKNEVNNLWQSYHFLVEKFFDKVKINKELKDLDLRKNLERKLELCEKAEELFLETSVTKSFKQLQQYHEDWKEIGPVPQDKKDEIWERFKTASDKINERRREFYGEIQADQDRNHLAKLALCERAEQLLANLPESLKQWQSLTQELNELLKVWKTIGPAPKKENNEVWKRFKASLDAHFVNYKEYLDKLKEHQMNNYNLKVDLCVQAEALRLSADWKETTRELIRLQKEWKEIGPVPRKHSDKIWKRFRAACDDFFVRKSEHFKNVSKSEEENLARKVELIQKVENFELGGNKAENLEVLKNLQREWMEIGHVPLKEKERLQAAFRLAINKHFDKLRITATEVSAMQYRSRIDSLKDHSEVGSRVFSRERTSLQQKISKLQEDIMVWENNIGFFAESKNASLVKKEFQKKIDQAKQELALLETKLRYLRES